MPYWNRLNRFNILNKPFYIYYPFFTSAEGAMYQSGGGDEARYLLCVGTAGSILGVQASLHAWTDQGFANDSCAFVGKLSYNFSILFILYICFVILPSTSFYAVWFWRTDFWHVLTLFDQPRKITNTWQAFFGHDLHKPTHILSNVRRCFAQPCPCGIRSIIAVCRCMQYVYVSITLYTSLYCNLL